MSQSISNRRQQRRPENKTNSKPSVLSVSQDVSFNSSSEIVEWDRELYDRKRETIRQHDHRKFASNLNTSEGSNSSLYKKCKKRADVYVEQVIAEQDAAYTHNIPHNMAIRNFIRKIDPETFTDETSLTNREKAEVSKSKDSSTKKIEGTADEQQSSSRKEQSDTELSQVTQTSSDESKTFSQIYSEICEESRARQKKAEQIYRIITHKETNQSENFFRSKSRERTARWVHNLGELRKDGESTTTETSNESDKESEYRQSSTNDHYFNEDGCKYLLPEESDMIDSFKQALRSGYRKSFFEYIAEMKNVQSECHEPAKGHSSHSEFKGSTRERNSIKSESHAELRSEMSEGSEKPRAQSLQNCSKLTENEVGKSKVLQFEHCEIYIRSPEPLPKTPTKAGSSVRTEGSNQMNSSQEKSEKCLDIKESGSKSKKVNSSTNKVQSSLKSAPGRKTRKSDTKQNAVYQKQFKENSSVDYANHKTEDEPSSGKNDIWQQNEANSSTYSLESRKEIISQRSEYNENFEQAGEVMSNTSLNSAKRVVSKSERSKQYEENTSNISFEAIEEELWNSSAYKSDADHVEEIQDNSIDFSLSHEDESQAYSSQHISNITHNSSSDVEEQSQKSFSKDGKLKWVAQLARFLSPHIERRKFLMPKDFQMLNADKHNEIERSESCAIRKSRRSQHRLNKSESGSIASHKSLQSAMNSTWPTERSTSDMHAYYNETNDCSLTYDNDSGDDYYLSSQNTSANTSLISSTLSMPNVTKKYRDRASSPIQVIYSDHSDSYERTARLEKIGYHKPGDRKARARGRRMKSEQLSEERSQTSIASEEKGVQYPSDDELNGSAKNSTKSPKISSRDEALPKVPKAGKGKQKKTGSSSNSSSCHSLPADNSGNSSSSTTNSSDYSICNYVPSVRFYRRSEPEEDVVMDLAHNDNDPPALTYKKHVARLAEHALRTCTNYYKESVEHSPELEEDIATKVGMLYNAETKFNTTQRLEKREDLLQQFNAQLHEQLKLVPPNVQ